MGLNTTYVKVIAFFLSAVFAGMGGNMSLPRSTTSARIPSHSVRPCSSWPCSSSAVKAASRRHRGRHHPDIPSRVASVCRQLLCDDLRFADSAHHSLPPGGVVGYVKTLWKRTVGPKLFKTTPVAEAPREFNARDLLMGRSKAYQKPAPSSTESPSFEDGQPSLAKTVEKEGDAS